MGRPKNTEKTRVTLGLTPKAHARLERLMVLSEADSLSEVVRRALALYEEALVHTEKGGTIVLHPASADEPMVRVTLV